VSQRYADFVAAKHRFAAPVGFDVAEETINALLFPFQRAVVRWALRRGRAAIFAGCGLGKTAMQLEWARLVSEHEHGPVLILAPLAVSSQTVREGQKFGIETRYSGDGSVYSPITVTNYERLAHFDPAAFVGIVLDESSILKSFDGKTRTEIIEAFRETPYRLACTATPAPNDHMELGNHSEFLGVLSRTEMLSQYFVHDGGETQKWRLKGHATDPFWRWMASWAVMARQPSDIGFSDDGFDLPPLDVSDIIVTIPPADEGLLFSLPALTLTEQRVSRRASLDLRVVQAAALANESAEPCLVWCELNDEGDALEEAIRDATQIRGSDTPEEKEQKLLAFVDGTVRVLVTKGSMSGFGLNLQHCAFEIFVGVSHSFEMTYQAIRRCWRFGQTRPVRVFMVRSDADEAIAANLARKEAEAVAMAESMVRHMRDFQEREIRGAHRELTIYAPSLALAIPEWLTTEAV
jgi:superfamily II DNA or RNA helicase